MTAVSRIAALESEVHVWLVRPDAVTDAAECAGYEALLDDGERARYRRFRFADDRHLFLVAHGLVRRVLSHYLEVDPAAWRFVRGAHGRPEIGTPSPPVNLRFNLSHTAGLAACVVTLDADCGVDVERLVTRRDMPGIAARLFAGPEQRDLRSRTDAADYMQRFFTYWTLREAWCKALGTGLAHAHGTVWFETGDGTRVTLHGLDGSGDTAAEWQCAVLQPTVMHRLALVVRRTAGLDRVVRCRFLGE